MALHGEDLGVELGKVYHAGKVLQDKVAVDFDDAWAAAPLAISMSTQRGGGIGNDPGAVLDTMLGQIEKMAWDNAANLRAAGEALVITANDFATTDTNVQTAFNTEKKNLGDA